MTVTDLTGIARGLAPLFQAIATRLAALEVKERGIDGASGAPGPRGPEGVPGPAGKEGKDGLAGRDGQDGLGFDDFDVDYDGERSFVFRWTQGTRVKDKTFKVPVFLDRGVYASGKAYEAGDGVTLGGSFWIAKGETTERPGTDSGASNWRLAVKAGRDGKEGKAGPEGKPGQSGKDGLDGRSWPR